MKRSLEITKTIKETVTVKKAKFTKHQRTKQSIYRGSCGLTKCNRSREKVYRKKPSA